MRDEATGDVTGAPTTAALIGVEEVEARRRERALILDNTRVVVVDRPMRPRSGAGSMARRRAGSETNEPE